MNYSDSSSDDNVSKESSGKFVTTDSDNETSKNDLKTPTLDDYNDDNNGVDDAKNGDSETKKNQEGEVPAESGEDGSSLPSTSPSAKPSNQDGSNEKEKGASAGSVVGTLQIPDVSGWAESILSASQKTLTLKHPAKTVFGTFENSEERKLYVNHLFLPSPKPGADRYPPPLVFMEDTHTTRLERAAALPITFLTRNMRMCDHTCGRNYRRPVLEAAAKKHVDHDNWWPESTDHITHEFYEYMDQKLEEKDLNGLKPEEMAVAILRLEEILSEDFFFFGKISCMRCGQWTERHPLESYCKNEIMSDSDYMLAMLWKNRDLIRVAKLLDYAQFSAKMVGNFPELIMAMANEAEIKAKEYIAVTTSLRERCETGEASLLAIEKEKDLVISDLRERTEKAENEVLRLTQVSRREVPRQWEFQNLKDRCDRMEQLVFEFYSTTFKMTKEWINMDQLKRFLDSKRSLIIKKKRPRSYRKECRVSRRCGKTRPTRVTGTKTQVHSPYSVISKLEEESPNEDQR